jgi:hypothetical protein
MDPGEERTHRQGFSGRNFMGRIAEEAMSDRPLQLMDRLWGVWTLDQDPRRPEVTEDSTPDNWAWKDPVEDPIKAAKMMALVVEAWRAQVRGALLLVIPETEAEKTKLEEVMNRLQFDPCDWNWELNQAMTEEEILEYKMPVCETDRSWAATMQRMANMDPLTVAMIYTPLAVLREDDEEE